MASRCTICGRADRPAIEADLRSDAGSLATIAARYGLSKTALIRHRDNHGSEPLNPVSNPAEHQAPATVRHRTRPPIMAEPVTDDSEAAAPDDAEPIPGPCEAVEPSVARLREVANLLARGLSRAEIAERYGVHVDTVTAWHRTIRERGILRVRSTTAAEIVATLLHNQAQRSRALWNIYHSAEAKGLPRVAITALDGLRKEDRHVFEIAQGIGAFDQFKLTPDDPTDLPPGHISAEFRADIRFLGDALKSLDDDEREDFGREFESMTERLFNTDPAELRARIEAETPAETAPQDIEPIF